MNSSNILYILQNAKISPLYAKTSTAPKSFHTNYWPHVKHIKLLLVTHLLHAKVLCFKDCVITEQKLKCFVSLIFNSFLPPNNLIWRFTFNTDIAVKFDIQDRIISVSFWWRLEEWYKFSGLHQAKHKINQIWNSCDTNNNATHLPNRANWNRPDQYFSKTKRRYINWIHNMLLGLPIVTFVKTFLW